MGTYRRARRTNLFRSVFVVLALSAAHLSALPPPAERRSLTPQTAPSSMFVRERLTGMRHQPSRSKQMETS